MKNIQAVTYWKKKNYLNVKRVLELDYESKSKVCITWLSIDKKSSFSKVP